MPDIAIPSKGGSVAKSPSRTSKAHLKEVDVSLFVVICSHLIHDHVAAMLC